MTIFTGNHGSSSIISASVRLHPGRRAEGKLSESETEELLGMRVVFLQWED